MKAFKAFASVLHLGNYTAFIIVAALYGPCQMGLTPVKVAFITIILRFGFSTRRRRTRTPKVRTALSRPCPAGQTDKGQRFLEIPDRIRTADRMETDRIRTDRHRTRFPENPDKNETRTGHGQYCPPTSAIQSFILDFLWEPSYIFLKISILSSSSDWLNVLR